MVKERMVTVEWTGRGRLSVDYNGKRYAFGVEPKIVEMPLNAYIIIMQSDSPYARNLLPLTASDQTAELEKKCKVKDLEIADLKEQIEELMKSVEIVDPKSVDVEPEIVKDAEPVEEKVNKEEADVKPEPKKASGKGKKK